MPKSSLVRGNHGHPKIFFNRTNQVNCRHICATDQDAVAASQVSIFHQGVKRLRLNLCWIPCFVESESSDVEDLKTVLLEINGHVIVHINAIRSCNDQV